jgi:adenylate cyclase
VTVMWSARARLFMRQIAIMSLVACLITPVFNVLTNEASVHEVVQGLVDALIIAPVVGGYLLFVRDGWLRAWFRRRNFLTNLALNTIVLLGLFLIGRAAGKVVTTWQPHRFVTSFREHHLLFALPFFVVVAMTMHFVVQISRGIGANVLGYFLAGVYHHPKVEQRVFLFLDLEGSTQLAERLGSAAYFQLLRRVADDLTEPVLETGGKIYQYAGDEVVITWRMSEAMRAANCVRCFFAIGAAVAPHAERYQHDFGVVPRFRAGLHGGTVTAGELGDLRQQIVFVGDVLNTAARLEEYAKMMGLDLVASGALLERLELPTDVTASRCGELALRGKEARVDAYGLSRRPASMSDTTAEPEPSVGRGAAMRT